MHYYLPHGEAPCWEREFLLVVQAANSGAGYVLAWWRSSLIRTELLLVVQAANSGAGYVLAWWRSSLIRTELLLVVQAAKSSTGYVLAWCKSSLIRTRIPIGYSGSQQQHRICTCLMKKLPDKREFLLVVQAANSSAGYVLAWWRSSLLRMSIPIGPWGNQ